MSLVPVESAPGRPLHVLTLTPFFPRAGNESNGCFVAEPLRELAAAGVRCSVLSVDPWYRPHATPLASPLQVEQIHYPAWPGGWGLASAGTGLFLKLRAPVKALHARTPVDLIHAHGALPCGRAAELLSRRFNIPFVVTVHGLDAFSTRQVGGWAGERCRTISRGVYAAARRVIGVSQHVCDQVRRGSDERVALSVVYNGVDAAMFTEGTDPVRPVLLTVGNLIPTKGHALVVRALAAIAAEHPALTWDVIGDGPERDRIRGLAAEMGVSGRVRFLGRKNREETAQAFRACTIFAMPSTYEGLGCVYLEAMASAKPAVGCRGQGIEEVIRHGENGWLVGMDNLEEITAGLRALLGSASLRTQIGAAARDSILRSFTLAHQSRQLLSVYKECAR